MFRIRPMRVQWRRLEGELDITSCRFSCSFRVSLTETHRVCFRRIPEDLIIRAHNDPDWIAANSVQTGEELDSEEDGDISVSDDSSSRSYSALSVLFCIIFVVCFVLCEMRLKRCCSLPEDADSSGSDSEAEKEEGDSDDDENEVEGVEDDDVDGAFFVLCIDMDFIWIRSQLGLQAKVAKARRRRRRRRRRRKRRKRRRRKTYLHSATNSSVVALAVVKTTPLPPPATATPIVPPALPPSILCAPTWSSGGLPGAGVLYWGWSRPPTGATRATLR